MSEDADWSSVANTIARQLKQKFALVYGKNKGGGC
jgi:hypothetical protein